MNSLKFASLLLLFTAWSQSSAQDFVSQETSSRDADASSGIAPQAIIPPTNTPSHGVLQAAGDGQSIDDVFRFKKLSEVELDIHGTTKRKPDSKFTELPIQAVVQPAITVYMWEAPAIQYQPLFFEDPTLERYGQDAGLLTPAVSGAHFFGRVLTLPFHAAVRSPFLSNEYPLGYGRPGNNNAYLHYQFPW